MVSACQSVTAICCSAVMGLHGPKECQRASPFLYLLALVSENASLGLLSLNSKAYDGFDRRFQEKLLCNRKWCVTLRSRHGTSRTTLEITRRILQVLLCSKHPGRTNDKRGNLPKTTAMKTNQNFSRRPRKPPPLSCASSLLPSRPAWRPRPPLLAYPPPERCAAIAAPPLQCQSTW